MMRGTVRRFMPPALLCFLFFSLGVPVFALGRRDTGAKPATDAVQAPAVAPEPVTPAAGATTPPTTPDALTAAGPNGTLVHTGDQVELSGQIRLLGSEPFPDLVLTDPEGRDWYMERQYRQILQSYEHQMVSIRGKVELRDMVLANGYSLGIRRFLSDVELVKNCIF
jgi:hypothetical protein